MARKIFSSNPGIAITILRLRDRMESTAPRSALADLIRNGNGEE
jgi:hypothetical protein